jgi:hypothetical protein
MKEIRKLSSLPTVFRTSDVLQAPESPSRARIVLFTSETVQKESFQAMISLAKTSAIWLDAELLNTFRAIQARQRKSPMLFCLHKFACAHNIVPSILNVLVKDWLSTVRAKKRAKSKYAEITKDFGDRCKGFHRNCHTRPRAAMFSLRHRAAFGRISEPALELVPLSYGRRRPLDVFRRRVTTIWELRSNEYS